MAVAAACMFQDIIQACDINIDKVGKEEENIYQERLARDLGWEQENSILILP